MTGCGRTPAPNLEAIAVRAAAPADAEAVAGIYNHYVTQTLATFEERPVSASGMLARIREVQAVPLPWLVAEAGGNVVGYAYATRWKGRAGYRLSVETTAYLRPGHEGRGIGSKLYGRLLAMLGECGIHAAMGGIALPNEASVALHEKFGFRKVAHFHEVGSKFDWWVDVGYWQRILRVGDFSR